MCDVEFSRGKSYSEIASDIKLVWEDPVTKNCLKKRNEFQLQDSAPYFLEKATEISRPDFTPSNEDVLRARSQTTGIITFKFQVVLREGRLHSFHFFLKVNNKSQSQNFDFELIDVGGQRTERRKWIHCFADVTAGSTLLHTSVSQSILSVMFVISLSDYNQTLFEDETTNRMQESEKVFGRPGLLLLK